MQCLFERVNKLRGSDENGTDVCSLVTTGKVPSDATKKSSPIVLI